ncbi:hypothetical protein C2G38_2201621 [Gigaspora rosea]|uniref:SWIM-type domain-containing protein n=1 Tax=Gigaspora rosea TaxID=44941 RepID=A0A397UXY0_9GLOM|nr:hypothetical protein C2G38_2201621 [Gigaspora rosea]
MKKKADSDYVAFEFRIKKIFAIGISDEILNEIHKFPFPVQEMIVDEFRAFEGRVKKGKISPGLTFLMCDCLFFRQYLLPCRHIFHEHLYGATQLLTSNAWRNFQQIFDEARFEIYMNHELVDVIMPERTEAERAAENRHLAINELMERACDAYWKVEEKGNSEQTNAFIRELKVRMDSVLNNRC